MSVAGLDDVCLDRNSQKHTAGDAAAIPSRVSQ